METRFALASSIASLTGSAIRPSPRSSSSARTCSSCPMSASSLAPRTDGQSPTASIAFPSRTKTFTIVSSMRRGKQRRPICLLHAATQPKSRFGTGREISSRFRAGTNRLARREDLPAGDRQASAMHSIPNSADVLHLRDRAGQQLRGGHEAKGCLTDCKCQAILALRRCCPLTCCKVRRTEDPVRTIGTAQHPWTLWAAGTAPVRGERPDRSGSLIATASAVAHIVCALWCLKLAAPIVSRCRWPPIGARRKSPTQAVGDLIAWRGFLAVPEPAVGAYKWFIVHRKMLVKFASIGNSQASGAGDGLDRLIQLGT